MNETEYLLPSEANSKRLLSSLENIKNGKTVKRELILLDNGKPTTNIFVLDFDIHTLQGVLEVNDLTVSFTVPSLQELKEEYGAVTIVEVVDIFSEEVVNMGFSEEVLEMIQDAVYDYAVEEFNSYFGDE